MKKINSYLPSVMAVALGVPFLFYVLIFYGVINSSGRASNVIAQVLLVAAALCAVVSITLHLGTLEKWEPMRRFWGLIDLAAISWWVTETILLAYAIAGSKVPVPSVADFFWVAGFLPVLMASGGVLVGYKRMGLHFDWRRSVWVIPPIAVILFVVAFWVIRPIMASPTATSADKFFHPTYAVLDLLVLLPALVVAITLGHSYAGRPIGLLSIALVAFGVGNIVYLWSNWNGFYYAGSFVDLFWIAGYLTLALASAPQPKPSLKRPLVD